MEKLQKFKFNLQLFAEDGGEPNQEPPKQKYSDEEYEKLKASFDKSASELADLKKQLKTKMTDEEKKAEEEKARQVEFEKMQKELSTMKVKTKLAGAFEEAEIEELSNLIIEGNVEKLVEKLVASRTAYKTKIYEEAKKEFQHSAKVPGGGNSGNDEVPSVIKDMIETNKSKGKDARDYWLNKK